jgi:hypothetical protein
VSDLELKYESLIAACPDIPTPKTEFKFALPRLWRADFAWPTHRLLVEIEGIGGRASRHTSVQGYSDDCEKYNAALCLGYRVLRFVRRHLNDGSALHCTRVALGLDSLDLGKAAPALKRRQKARAARKKSGPKGVKQGA